MGAANTVRVPQECIVVICKDDGISVRQVHQCFLVTRFYCHFDILLTIKFAVKHCLGLHISRGEGKNKTVIREPGVCAGNLRPAVISPLLCRFSMPVDRELRHGTLFLLDAPEIAEKQND